MISYFPILDLVREKAKEINGKINNIKNITSIEKSNIFLVGGGDGFMLDTIKKYYEKNKEKVFFGINCGTLGFLLNDIEVEQLPKKIKDIHIININPIEVELEKNDGKIIKNFAINDIVIGGNIGDYFSFNINGKTFCQNIKGTGIIISSSIGSSAYWLNNGGPLIPTESNLWGIMGIASKPFNFKIFEKQEIKITIEGRKDTLCFVDGYSGKEDNIKRIKLKKSGKIVKLGFIENIETKRILLLEKKYTNH